MTATKMPTTNVISLAHIFILLAIDLYIINCCVVSN